MFDNLYAEKDKLEKWKFESLTKSAKDMPAIGAQFAALNRHLEISDP
jgi:hypothetical protein